MCLLHVVRGFVIDEDRWLNKCMVVPTTRRRLLCADWYASNSHEKILSNWINSMETQIKIQFSKVRPLLYKTPTPYRHSFEPVCTPELLWRNHILILPYKEEFAFLPAMVNTCRCLKSHLHVPTSSWQIFDWKTSRTCSTALRGQLAH